MQQLAALWKRPDVRFLVLFFAILGVSFLVVALRPVNDAVVLPYTGFVARLAGFVLSGLGEEVTLHGCELTTPRFGMTIYNGCNGLITSLIFVAGVLAFPSTLRAKLVGLLLGMLAIQVVNLVRIVALYYTGVFLPQYFGQAHIFVWQSIVILSGVALWMVWASRWAAHGRSAT